MSRNDLQRRHIATRAETGLRTKQNDKSAGFQRDARIPDACTLHFKYDLTPNQIAKEPARPEPRHDDPKNR